MQLARSRLSIDRSRRVQDDARREARSPQACANLQETLFAAALAGSVHAGGIFALGGLGLCILNLCAFDAVIGRLPRACKSHRGLMRTEFFTLLPNAFRTRGNRCVEGCVQASLP